jgi:Ca-activated chloride channel family protein
MFDANRDKSVRVSRPWGAVVWRLVLAGLVLLVLWNPQIHFGKAAGDLIFLVDVSSSMKHRNMERAIESLDDALSNLPTGSRFSVIQFGSEPHQTTELKAATAETLDVLRSASSLSPPDWMDLRSTNIEKALDAALSLTSPDRPANVILITDGEAKDGNTRMLLTSRRRENLSVRWLEPQRDAPGIDAVLSGFYGPSVARKGQAIPFVVEAYSTSRVDGRIIVTIAGRQARKEISVALEPNRPNRFNLQITPESTGEITVTARLLVAGDAMPENNELSKSLRVVDRGHVVYVSRESGVPTVVRSLRMGGWSVDWLRPAQFPSSFNALGEVEAIILDDVAIGDMSGAAWVTLEKAVRGGGAGLIVLGGKNSFAAGGYRGSRLENILPVTSEAPETKGRAAIMFVVDKSGSMGQTQNSTERFSYAREAVLGTVAALDESDLVGLLLFDAAPSVVLPIEAGSHKSRFSDNAWDAKPSGGTKLALALESAVNRLTKVDVDQRLIILVTDGSVESREQLLAVRRKIQSLSIEMVVLLIGSGAEDRTMLSLVGERADRLLNVSDVTMLPRLMRAGFEKWKTPFRTGTSTPKQNLPIPFMDETRRWPDVTGYCVTTARPGSDVFLKSDRGMTLLASHFSGSGRVVALPAGLGPWAADWQSWSGWGKFMGGITDWVTKNNESDALELRTRFETGRLHITTDAIASDGRWLSGDPAEATVLGPAGNTVSAMLDEIAPGRYSGNLKTSLPGRYLLTVRVGSHSLQRSLQYQMTGEKFPFPTLQNNLSRLVEEGLLSRWSSGVPVFQQSDRQAVDLRKFSIPGLFVFLIFCLVIECTRAGGRTILPPYYKRLLRVCGFRFAPPNR